MHAPRFLASLAPLAPLWNSGLVTIAQLGGGGGESGAGGDIIIVRAPLRKFVVTKATTLRWVLIAPFGRPVVPLV